MHRYGHQQHMNLVDDQSNADEVDCVFCHLEVTEPPSRCAPTAVDLLELLYEDTNHDVSVDAIHTGLRTLIAECNDRLSESGYLDEHVGITVKSWTDWRSVRSELDDTAEFDELLRDGVEVCIVFDIAYMPIPNDYTTLDELLDSAASGEFGMTGEKNAAKTLQWIDDYTPTTIDPDIDSILQKINGTGIENKSQTPKASQVIDEPTEPESTGEQASLTNY